MPNFNGTGPAGTGAGTGRGLGPCGAGTAYGRRGLGGGLGRGLGLRRFWGWKFPKNSVLTKEREVEILSGEASALEQELEAVKSRLGELKK